MKLSVGKGAPSGKMVYENNWTSHWFFGIIGEEIVDIKKVCPSGNATIHDEISFVNGLIGFLIGIVYYPSTVTVRCDTGEMTQIELTTEQVAKLVSDPYFLDLVEEIAPERIKEAMIAQNKAMEYL